MRKTILSIAILAAGAAAVPFGFAGGDNCSDKTAGATLVSTGSGSCTGGSCPADKATAVSTGSGCTAEKTTLVSTGGDNCSAKTAAGSGCTSEKTSLVSTGGDQCTEKSAAASSGCCPSGDKATLVSTDGGAADKAAKPMDALKALSGKWKEVEKAGDANTGGTLEFRVSAAGSVVVETMFPGQKHEMVNTYAMDGDRLLLTHYCAGGNQPRMALVSNDGKTMKFRFVDATNLKSPDAPHMGALELTIMGPDRIHEKWTSFDKGKEVDHVEIELERVK